MRRTSLSGGYKKAKKEEKSFAPLAFLHYILFRSG
jgi:hypothetical protein